jgi:hypothetical protein
MPGLGFGRPRPIGTRGVPQRPGPSFGGPPQGPGGFQGRPAGGPAPFGQGGPSPLVAALQSMFAAAAPGTAGAPNLVQPLGGPVSQVPGDASTLGDPAALQDLIDNLLGQDPNQFQRGQQPQQPPPTVNPQDLWYQGDAGLRPPTDPNRPDARLWNPALPGQL